MSTLLALALNDLLQQQSGLLLIAAPNTQTAEELHTALKFFNPDKPIYTFPNWETLPYDHFSPHEDIISTRLKLLAKLPQLTTGALIVAAPTLAYPLCPKSHLQKNSFVLDCKDELNINALREQLTQSGYYPVSEVFSHGEFSIRGSIIDIFPMGNPFPYRIDLLDNEVESIRIFDPNTQRSHEKINRIELLPAKEFSLDKDSITHFREAYRAEFSGDPTASDIYQAITKGSVPAGIEYYLPLFFDKINHLSDY
ncbi:MAG: transcription-repair coupling factor, partial [Gammaproteobacteria bacterium]